MTDDEIPQDDIAGDKLANYTIKNLPLKARIRASNAARTAGEPLGVWMDPRQLAYEAHRAAMRESWWKERTAWCHKMGVDVVTGRWLVEPEETQWEEGT